MTQENKYLIYTSVARDGNNILLMGYDKMGYPVKEKIKFKPEIFLPRESGKYRTITDEHCDRKEFESISDCNDYVEMYKDLYKIYGCNDYVRQFIGRTFRGELTGYQKYINVWWFDIETEVSSGFPEPSKAHERISLITMYNRTTKKIYTWGLYAIDDPEVNSKLSPEEIQENIDWIRNLEVDYRSFSNEESLLLDFLNFVQENRLDILSGWNSEVFDIPYLYNRIVNVLGESYAQKLSPWKIVKEHKKYQNDNEVLSYDIVGVGHVDLMDLYKKFNPGSKESFALDFIAEYELGENKLELPGESFRDSYENYWSTFVRYNIKDAILLQKIDEKKQIIDLCLSISYFAKCNYPDVLSAMRTWESLIYNYFLDRDIVETWSKTRVEKMPLEGAYVHDPVPGAYRWVVSVDATSMYPSFMMQNNLSPETVIRKINFTPEDFLKGNIPELAEDEILSCNGLITSKSKVGFISTLTKKVFDDRKNAKNRMLELKKTVKAIEDSLERFATEQEIAALNMKQNVLKVLGNSLYGVCSLTHFKYYDHYIAEAITLSGQSYLKTTMRIINETLNRICETEGVIYAFYGDTDSIFFTAEALVQKFWKDLDDKEIVGKLEKFVMKVLQKEINDQLDALSARMGAPENKLFFKLEGISKNAIWLAKKRYIAALKYNEGVWYEPEEMKIMGMEIVRSSTPKFIKEKLKEAVEICIKGTEEELQDYVAQFEDVFMSKDIEDISFPRSCNGISTYFDPVNRYKPKTPIHVRASIIHNMLVDELGLDHKIRKITDGDKIKFIHLNMPNPVHEDVIAYVGKFPKEFELSKYVDKKTMFEKVFIGPLEGVLDVIGWKWKHENTLDF